MKAIFKAGAALALVGMAVQAGARDDHAAAETGEADKAAAIAEASRAADLWVEGYRRYNAIPAISAAVANGEKTVWARGFGHTDKADTIPATADTIYSICSISKLFTAIALMQQWEQGKVALDSPISDYLPWAQLADDPRESVPITLRGALTHSAGLPREVGFPYWTGPDFPFPSRAQIRERIGTQAPLYPASTTFQYSNLGLTLVGETVEATSGVPYADYVTANILQPLGLDDTRPFLPMDLYGTRMPKGYGALRADLTRPEVNVFDAAGLTPAAGFTSSVNDLAKFASWTFRLAETGEADVLRASTLREMQRVHYLTPDWKRGFGLGFATWQADGTNVVGHGGNCPGYNSSLAIAPSEKMAVAVAMNANGNANQVGDGIAALFKARGNAKPFDTPESGPVNLAEFAGTYDQQPWDGRAILIPWSGGLAALVLSADKPAETMVRLKPLGGDRFLVVNSAGEEREPVTFRRDAQGRIVGLEWFQNFSPRVAPL